LALVQVDWSWIFESSYRLGVIERERKISVYSYSLPAPFSEGRRLDAEMAKAALGLRAKRGPLYLARIIPSNGPQTGIGTEKLLLIEGTLSNEFLFPPDHEA